MEDHSFPYDFRARESPQSEYSEPSEYTTFTKDKFGQVSDSLSFLRCMRKRLENLSRRIPSDKSAGRLDSQKMNTKPAAVEGSGDLFSIVQNPNAREEEDQLRVAQEEIETVLRTSLIGLRQASRLIKGNTDGRTDQPTSSLRKPDTKASVCSPLIGSYKRRQSDELYELPSRICESPVKRNKLSSQCPGVIGENSDPPAELEAIAKCFRSLLSGLLEDKKTVCSSVQTNGFLQNKPTCPPSSPLPSMRRKREPTRDYMNTDTSSSSVEPTDLEADDRRFSARRLVGSQSIHQSHFSPEPMYKRSNASTKSDVVRMLTTIERSLELLAADVRQENSEIAELVCRSIAKSRVQEKDRMYKQSLPTTKQVYELKQAVEDLIYKVLFKRRKLKRLLRLRLKNHASSRRPLDPRSTPDMPSSLDYCIDTPVVRSQKPSRRKSPYTRLKTEIMDGEKSPVKRRQEISLSKDDPKSEMLMALKVLRRDADRLISSLAVDNKRPSMKMPSVYSRVVRDNSDEDE
ncbi:hypothetical protein AAHC03_024207 [Spirometra sp. Aus1]